MFGTLRPHRACAGEESRQWRRMYCGLCQGLGAQLGQAWRGMHSNDAVLIALVADGIQAEAAPHTRCRCPLMPVTHRPSVTPDSPASRYAVAIQALLADQWVADKAVEGSRLARSLRPALSGPVSTAQDLLADLGVDLSAVAGVELRQHRVEATGQASPLRAAAPTRDALALVFQGAADLPGTAPAATTPQARAALRQLGAGVGTLIYLIDAFDDIADDCLEAAFNPCLDGRGQIDPDRLEAAFSAARAALDEVQTALDVIPWRRHHTVIRSVLGAGLSASLQRAITRARQWAAAQDTLVPGGQAGWWSGTWRRAAQWLTVFWASWFLPRPAEAALEPQLNHFCHPDCVPSADRRKGLYQLDDCLAAFLDSPGDAWRLFNRESAEHWAHIERAWSSQRSLETRATRICWTEPGHWLDQACWGATTTCFWPDAASDYCCGTGGHNCWPGWCDDLTVCTCTACMGCTGTDGKAGDLRDVLPMD